MREISRKDYWACILTECGAALECEFWWDLTYKSSCKSDLSNNFSNTLPNHGIAAIVTRAIVTTIELTLTIRIACRGQKAWLDCRGQKAWLACRGQKV